MNPNRLAAFRSVRRLLLPVALLALGCLSTAGRAPLAEPPAFDSTAALAKARALRSSVSAGDAAALWREFSPTMRAAMRDSASFGAMTAMLSMQLGAIDSVLSEEVTRQGGGFRIVALCKFANPPDPMRLLTTFDAEGRVDGLAVRPNSPPKEAPSAFLDYQTKTPLRLPFEGEWFVFWGGRTLAQNYHAATRSQRFAHDLVIMKDGKSHKGDGQALTDYYCYGAPLLAPGDGIVAWVEDQQPDQAIGTTNATTPIGNGVVIDHGNGEFSLLAHMQPRSLRVKQGDRVKAGQPLGRCGNSGNTSEPHLHYHLQNGPEMGEADGLPAFFRDLVVDGEPVERAEIVKGQQVKPAK